MAAAAATSIVLRSIVLAIVIITPNVLAKSCETEQYEDGVCVPFQNCEAFKQSLADSVMSPGQRAIVERERAKCADEGDRSVCCKRKPRPEIPRSYEGIHPVKKGQIGLLPDDDDCGIDSADRIFYGNVTALDQFPWLALIKYIDEDENEAFKCGGSLISKRYVLTAAHCINPMIAGVRLGEWDLDTNPDCQLKQRKQVCADPVLDVGIEKIAMHKNYTRRVSKGGKIDMALLRLDREIDFGTYVSPVCLPRLEIQSRIASEQKFFVAGWGMTEHGSTSTKKLYVDVNNVELDECRRLINAPLIKIDETMICALGKGGKDACQGDSGGPLMQIKAGDNGVHPGTGYYLKGVVSKGLTCGSTKPGFYTNVYEQFDWIVSNMEP